MVFISSRLVELLEPLQRGPLFEVKACYIMTSRTNLFHRLSLRPSQLSARIEDRLAGLGQIAHPARLSHLLWRVPRAQAFFACVVQSLLFSVFFFNCAGCASPGASARESTPPRQAPSGELLYDPGDDVLLEKEERPLGTAPGSALSTPPSSGSWSIALATLTGSDHQALARSLAERIRDRYPTLTPLFVDGLGRGEASAVFVGHFRSPSGEASRSMMNRVSELTMENGGKAFPRAMPARPASFKNASRSPNDLRSLRSRHRVGRIAYSLKIAQWGTFGDDQVDYEQCRQQAEAMSRSLRAQGLTAWFNHNDAREMSVVTVGVFGSNAYDSRSTLFAPEVEVLMERFPQLMINGEPILHPKTGQPLPPVLIEVPK